MTSADGIDNDKSFSKHVDELFSSLDFKDMETSPFGFFQDSGKSFVEQIADLLHGEVIDGDGFFKGVIKLVFSEITSVIPLITALLGIIILLSLFSCFEEGFFTKGIRGVVSLCACLAVSVLLLSKIIALSNEVKESITLMEGQMNAVFPPLMTLLVAASQNTLSPTLSPFLYFLTTVVTKFVKDAVFPLYLTTVAINFISYLSKDVSVSKLAESTRSLATSLLTTLLAVYSVAITVSGISAGSYDGIAYKTARIALAKSVTIIGGFVRDGFDLVLYSANLVKNSVGIMAVITFTASALTPIMKVTVFSIALKFAAAIAQPFSSGGVSQLLYDLAKTQNVLIAASCTVFVMGVISVLIMILAGAAYL